MNPRAGLDDVEKKKCLTLPGLELRPLGRPPRSQTLYRPRFPGSEGFCTIVVDIMPEIISVAYHLHWSIAKSSLTWSSRPYSSLSMEREMKTCT
jgi:hypothetical protein